MLRVFFTLVALLRFLEAHKESLCSCIVVPHSIQHHHPLLVFNFSTEEYKYRECIQFPGGVLNIDDSLDSDLKSQKSLQHYDHRSHAHDCSL